MKPIFIVGYMGVGKTTIGQKLADNMELNHIDTDKLIVESYGQSVSDIFASKGEQFFRQKEREILRQLLTAENTVISLGGGTPCFFDNMDMISSNGIVIFLRMRTENILFRLLSEKENRPLVANKTGSELRDFVTVSLRDRMKYYGQAHFMIDVDNKKVEQIIEEIINNEYIREQTKTTF